MNSSALIGGKFIFKQKSFTIFALQFECCNFNQWEHSIYNRLCDLYITLLILTNSNWKPPRFKTFSVLHVQTYLGLSCYSFAIYCALGAILFLSTVGKGALQKYLRWNYIWYLKHIVKAENTYWTEAPKDCTIDCYALVPHLQATLIGGVYMYCQSSQNHFF